MNEPGNIAVRVFDRCDQLTPSDVLHLLLDLCARVDEHLQTLLGVPGSRSPNLSGRARAARPELIDGSAGLVWGSADHPRVVFEFGITAGRIVEIHLIADPARLSRLELVVVEE